MKNIKHKIYKFFREIVKEVVEERARKDLKIYCDLAKLILDCKTDKISLQTIDFLSRMDINPEEFNNK